MIVDTLEHASALALGDRFAKAFAWLKEAVKNPPAPGHHVLERADDGTETLYANVQAYVTRAPQDCPLEYHRAYADVQFLLEGQEAIGWRPLTSDLAERKPYDTTNDIGFVEGAGTPIPFPKDGFFVLFPQDAHAPGMRVPGAENVRKIVVKVLL